MYTISRCLNGFFFAVPRQDAREETEAGEHEALEDQAELEGIPRAQSFLGDHVEGAETDGECFLNFPTLSHSLSPCSIRSIFQQRACKPTSPSITDPEVARCKKENKRKRVRDTIYDFSESARGRKNSTIIDSSLWHLAN